MATPNIDAAILAAGEAPAAIYSPHKLVAGPVWKKLTESELRGAIVAALRAVVQKDMPRHMRVRRMHELYRELWGEE